jgi:5-formyltetrahydrofolate cyclo-ligase
VVAHIPGRRGTLPDVADDVESRKSELRHAVVAARAAIGTDRRTAAGAAIAAAGLERWRDLGTIAAYLSVGNEPPTRELVDALTAAGVRVLLPIIDADGLDWAAYSGPDDLARGPLGIVEPTGPRLGVTALTSATVVVVPALAVDRQGNRLGRGRGFYDRALVGVTAPVVAVLYDEELFDAVPSEPHDRRVDEVLQPRGFTSSS